MPDIQGYKNGKPDVAFWMEQIKWGLEWRKQRAFEDRWPIWQKYYRGEWKPDILPYNLFYKFIRSIVPKIYFRNPSVSVISAKAGVENYILTQLMENTDNRLIRQMDIKTEMKRMVQSAWIKGTGVGKLGFGAEYAVAPDPSGVTEGPIINGKQQLEYDRRIIPNMPWFKHTHTGNYIVPWGTIYKEAARWDCFIVSRPVEDVKLDPRFKTPNDLKASGSFDLSGNAVTKPGEKHPDRMAMIDLYEIRDKKTNDVFVLTASHDEALLHEQDVYGSIGIDPAFTLIFNEDDEGFWGVPDSNILEPMQKEMNEIHTYAMYHRRLSIIKLIYQKGMVDTDELQKMLTGDLLAAVGVNGPIDEALKVMQGGFIPADLFQAGNVLEGNIRDVMGQSRNQSGEFRQGSEAATAEEVREVSEAANIRTDERRDMVADLLVKLVKDINPVLFRSWNEQTVEKIVGPGGVPIWVQFTPKMLERGHYEFRIDPDNTLPETKGLREQKALRMYEVLKMNPLISPLELTRYLLHELHGTMWDDLMRGLPQGQGLSQEQPLSVGQFGTLINNTQAQNPALLQGPGAQQ